MIKEHDQWLGVELRHFAALQAIASTGSFRRAAEELGYTQSAVSQQIATLERIVGETLIDRPGGPRKVSLTEAGHLLLRHANVILARLHAAQADVWALAEGASGHLRVGAYQSISRHVLPGLMRHFASEWPQVEIQLTESAHDADLLPPIERGELDLSFAMLPLPEGPFAFAELLRDPYVLVVPADSPLVSSDVAPGLREIAQLPLIGFRQCRSMEQIEIHLQSSGIEPRFVFRSDDNGTIQALIAAGMGVGLVPRLTVDALDDRIVMLPLSVDMPPRRLALVWHQDRYRSTAARAFVDTACLLSATLQSTLHPTRVST